MDASRQRTEGTVQLARQAEQALVEITHSIGTIEQMSQQISAAAEEQSAVTDEINRSVISVRDIADPARHGRALPDLMVIALLQSGRVATGGVAKSSAVRQRCSTNCRKRRVRSFSGFSRISLAEPSATIRPPSMNKTRSAMSCANFISWVTSSMVI